MFHVCHAFLSVHCSLVVTCWERADLLALLYVMFSCVFVTFPCGVLGRVWYLIVSIPDLCLLTYFNIHHIDPGHMHKSHIRMMDNRVSCIECGGYALALYFVFDHGL